MLTIIIVCAVVVLLFKGSPYIFATFEKEHLRNDLEPKEYNAAAWGSECLDSRVKLADELGLVFAGTYFTAKDASIVKGYSLFYVDLRSNLIVNFVSARFAKAELERTSVASMFADGSALTTSDHFCIPDCTGGIERVVRYKASLDDLIRIHKEKLADYSKTAVVVSTSSAFTIFEQVDYMRGERMVQAGLAKWTDVPQTKIRRTFRGVLAAVKVSERAKRQIIEDEVARRRANSD